MLITTGKVHRGTIEFDAKSLPEGAKVTVLAQEGDETFELGPEEESKLLASIAEAERGETVSVSQVLRRMKIPPLKKGGEGGFSNQDCVTSAFVTVDVFALWHTSRGSQPPV